MRPPLFSPLLRTGSLILAGLMVIGRPAAAADPVLELEELLERDINPENRAEITRRKELLQTHLKSLTRPSVVRDALLLPGWKRSDFAPQPGEDDPLGKIYHEVWGQLADRLAKTLRSRLTEDDVQRRLVAVTFLAEMASAESIAEQGGFPLARRFRGMISNGPVIRFTPRMVGDLRKLLAADKDAEVCAAAIRAVVEIAPTEAATLEALKPLLEPARRLAERRAAAEGLDRMLRARRDSPPDERTIPRPGVAPRQIPPQIDRLGASLVSAAGAGLGDKEPAIRRLCLETIRQVIQQLRWNGQPTEPFRRLARAVNAQMTATVGLLADGDLAVRLSAHQVLEATAAMRRNLRRDDSGRDALPRAAPKRPAAEGALLDDVLKAMPALKTSLADKEVRVRLAALYVLETFDAGAVPSVDAVAGALKDKNGFVRWGAARVLNNMAPLAFEKAVPALGAALKDDNLTVRLTAANALRRYGPKAAEAVEPLGAAIGDAEPRVRVAAINALAEIGAKAASQSGALARVLKDDKSPEARAAAAKALGRLGPLGKESLQALRRALRDADAAVRQAASDALLDNEPMGAPRDKCAGAADG